MSKISKYYKIIVRLDRVKSIDKHPNNAHSRNACTFKNVAEQVNHKRVNGLYGDDGITVVSFVGQKVLSAESFINCAACVVPLRNMTRIGIPKRIHGEM